MNMMNKNGDSTLYNNQDSIAFIYNGESVKISGDDILYIEQCGSKLHICKTDNDIEVSGKMSALSAALGEPFIQCHSYLIVNFSKIESMSKKQIIFKNQHHMKLARDTYYKIRKLFNQYIAMTCKII